MTKTIRALLVLTAAALLAFAPAPFPRARRSSEELSLKHLQGKWSFVGEYVWLGDRWTPQLPVECLQVDLAPLYSEVRITDDRLTFYQGNKAVVAHRITIDGSKTPAAIDFYFDNERIREGRNRPPAHPASGQATICRSCRCG
jgi:hypothetical protein